MKSKQTHLIFGVLTPILLLGIVLGASAQTHIIAQELKDAGGWFGGDNRPNSRRTVGVGQLVLMDTAMTVNSFSLHFASPFDFAQNPTGSGHEVTLRLQVRNRAGAILKTTEVVVPASFSSGWVTWDALGLTVTTGIKLFFTAYVVGGFDTHQYFTSYSATATDPYSGGTVMLKDGQSDADLDVWDDWVPNSGWDAAFRLNGTIITTATDRADAAFAGDAQLTQVSPNPVRSEATIAFHSTQHRAVTLALYNLAGMRVRTLAEGDFPPGTHSVRWTNDGLQNGVYCVVLRAGDAVRSHLISIVR